MPPNRKPAFIRHLEGNRSRTKIPDEPVGKGLPREPEHLTRSQRERWRDIVDSLPIGLLSQADEQALERMAVAWALFRETLAKMKRRPLLIKGMPNPLFVIQRRAAKEMHECGLILGLSPVARTRLVKPPDNEANPLDVLMSPANQNRGKRNNAA